MFEFRNRLNVLVERLKGRSRDINVDLSRQLFLGLCEDIQLEAEKTISTQEALDTKLSEEEVFKLIQVARALHKPNGIASNRYNPNFVLNSVLSLSSSAIDTCQ